MCLFMDAKSIWSWRKKLIEMFLNGKLFFINETRDIKSKIAVIYMSFYLSIFL